MAVVDECIGLFSPTEIQAVCRVTLLPLTLDARFCRHTLAHSCRHLSSSGYGLLDVRQLPRLVEECFIWVVQTETAEPTPTRRGVNPVRLLACWWLRTEVDVDRTVGVFLHRLVIRIESDHRRFADEGIRVAVVGNRRPILLSRDVGWNSQSVAVLATHRLAALINEGDDVRDAPALPHPFGKTERSKVRQSASVHIHGVVSFVAEVGLDAPGVRKTPVSFCPPLRAKSPHLFHKYRQCLLGSFFKDALGRRVGLELLALLDADGLQHAHRNQVTRPYWLFLDHPGEALKKTFVKTGDTVESLSMDVDETLLRRIGRLSEGIDAQFLDQCKRSRDVGVS